MLLKRQLLFLFGCIPLRLLLSYSPYYLNKWIVIAALTITALVWLYLFAFNLRQTGAEVFGDKIWWSSIRPLHALIYLTAAYFLYQNKKNIAQKVLVFDVFIGLNFYFLFRLGLF